MPQISSTIPQSTLDAINAKAKEERRNASQVVSIILQDWEARNKSKNTKK